MDIVKRSKGPAESMSERSGHTGTRTGLRMMAPWTFEGDKGHLKEKSKWAFAGARANAFREVR